MNFVVKTITVMQNFDEIFGFSFTALSSKISRFGYLVHVF